MSSLNRVHVVDSHTGGEPTRVVIDGGPPLGEGNLQDRLNLFRTRYDIFRTAIVAEPRGSEVIVGALLCKPVNPAAAAAVIFFNDVGYLGMCGHGTIGLVTTLAHLGRIGTGKHAIETPVGTVYTQLHDNGKVSVQNVTSYRYRADVVVDVPAYGQIAGDIAWGGNWFFLVKDHPFDLEIKNRNELIGFTTAIRSALASAGVTGKDGAAIDHIELFSSPKDPANSSRNFVLCPGASFDRSPCGTGTSAKLACMHAAGTLVPGAQWRQEGILDSVFVGSVQETPNEVIPTITGQAWITVESTLIFDQTDPFREGIRFT
jgi:4-hydroxyproline epimerase